VLAQEVAIPSEPGVKAGRRPPRQRRVAAFTSARFWSIFPKALVFHTERSIPQPAALFLMAPLRGVLMLKMHQSLQKKPWTQSRHVRYDSSMNFTYRQRVNFFGAASVSWRYSF